MNPTRAPEETGRTASMEDDDGLIAIYTTVGTLESAQAMACGLVDRRLVACAQITPVESFYRWGGQTRHDQEFRLMLKTAPARYAAVEAAIRSLHPYELPSIFAIPVGAAFGPYRAWVHDALLP